jgi:hypothetical protein
VTLTAPAPASGLNISVTSSDPGVATVPASVNVVAGMTTVTFTVTAVAAGMTTISASLNGTQSALLTVTGPPTSLMISLSAASVVGGNSVAGTVSLNNAAPSGGAVVTLNGNDPVSVPPSVTIAAGQTSAMFTVSTRAVGGTFNVTISATYGGLTASTTLTVTQMPQSLPVARFSVSGPSGTNACKLINNGNDFDCTFDASASTAPAAIVSYVWNYAIAKNKQEMSTTPVFHPNPNCGLLPSPLPNPKPTSLQMIVSLQVSDKLGNTSATVTNNNVRILPSGQACGF